MNARRLREWWRVVWNEAGLADRPWWTWGQSDVDRVAGILTRMVKTVVFGEGRVSMSEYRHRRRVCLRCPVYARDWKQCLLVDGGDRYGCGCYVPFLALVRVPYPSGCWWREYVGEAGGWA